MKVFKKANFNAKIADIKSVIPSITDLPTAATFNAIKNKITEVNDLVRKRDCDTKILDFETKYFTTTDYANFTGKILTEKIKKVSLRILIFLGL